MSRPSKKSDDGQDGLRITNQFRTRNGFAYELRFEGARLEVLVTPRTSEDDGGDWHVEASVKTSPEQTIGHWASSKSEALRLTAATWAERSAELGLPTFDWNAITRALVAVRAV